MNPQSTGRLRLVATLTESPILAARSGYRYVKVK